MRRARGVASATRFVDPLAAWTTLAWKSAEMLAASAQVIAHRSARIAAAGPLPSARDRAEFARMGWEKAEAAVECANGIARAALREHPAGALRLWQEAMGLGLELASLASSVTPAQAMDRHARVARRLVSAAAAAATLAGATAAISTEALLPLHRRTHANVKRLTGG